MAYTLRPTLLRALPICVCLPALAHAADLTLPQRIAAAQATAQNSAECMAIQPFYWELGNSLRSLASGRVGRDAPGPRTTLAYASASKWIYGAFVAEQRQGRLSPSDYSYLNFTSGYTRFRICARSDTVQSCQARPLNGAGAQDDATTGKFDYNGGHMQQHATLMRLGALDNAGLAAAIRTGLSPLGSDWQISYNQPQLAGGAAGSAEDYAKYLRGILNGSLQMSKLLGAHPVCTNPATCNTAVKTPIPPTESWHYAIGHWVEDDPLTGDGAFSSPGAFGFYPWIDASKTYYGIIAREDRSGLRSADSDEKPAVQSVACGRKIRAAWLAGSAEQ